QARGVSFVAARYERNCGWIAVKQDGTLIASGEEDGEIPAGLTKPRWLDVGEQVIAVKQEGTLAIWGHGSWKPKSELRNVIKAESGFENSIALHTDGTVSVWGPLYDRMTPKPEWLRDAVDVAAGVQCAWVLKADGSVIGWDAKGELIPLEEGDYRTLKDMVSISGTHRGLIGLDKLGRFVSSKEPVPTPLGALREVASGYMLNIGVSRGGRLFVHDAYRNEKRFPEALAPALAARNVMQAACAGDGTDPFFFGFIVWIEGNELPRPKPGRLFVAGYHQNNGKEEPINAPTEASMLCAAAKVRDGGGWIGWTESQERKGGHMSATMDGASFYDTVELQADFQVLSLRANGVLQIFESDPKPDPAQLRDVVQMDMRAYSAVALKRDGSVVLWNQDKSPSQLFHPAAKWLGDVVQARGGFEKNVWWFLRRDGSVGRSHDKDVSVYSAFDEPVQAIEPTRVNACLALTLDGRIVFNKEADFHNPLLKKLPNDRGPFIDLRCGGHAAAAQRPDGTWIAWGSEESKDQAIFKQLEAAGPLRDVQIRANFTRYSNEPAGNLIITGIHTP
ncbi:MAG: hypothetical protein KDK99_04620, partial [Verrucomicrobiales bacterium]|nr:hypothetical protein [Verrucomicrobiales bacterium]